MFSNSPGSCYLFSFIVEILHTPGSYYLTFSLLDLISELTVPLIPTPFSTGFTFHMTSFVFRISFFKMTQYFNN